MSSLLQDWYYALLKELNAHKGKAALLFGIVTLATVAAGLVWPKTFESAAIIFADEQNIIKPLLSGSAEVTKLESDQSSAVRERIIANRILEQVAVETKLAPAGADRYTMEPILRNLRSNIVVTDAGQGHIRVAYRAREPEVAFNIASAIVKVFIADSSRTKRAESREAFTFIDEQVKTYKTQLQQAEERLKNFKSNNIGGSEDRASSRISELRSSLETLSLDLQVARARRNELQQQISHESQYINQRYKSDVYRDRLAQAQSRLETLRLSYEDTYPDIVSLKQQIQDLQRAITETENEPTGGSGSGNNNNTGSNANPVYQKLRGDLADAEVSVRTLELRVASTSKLLNEEHSNSKQIAENQAQIAELTRDYNVTKQMYESMLERKEKARLSMALDVEGQGVNYKIKEPPVYPTHPVGLRFLHFYVAAPLLGLLVPLGLLVAYIQLDPRIRFVDRLQQCLPASAPVLGVVPHLVTSFERTVVKSQWTNIAIFAFAIMLVYAAVAVIRLIGVV
jgi:polysaccharide chain length determinant protein (PEP-CTERM system associated)